jgi:anaerobic selenocysteine-containing dehydrogenase
MQGTGGRPLALFDTHRPATPSGKVELVSDVLSERWGRGARLPSFRPRATRFPLMLVSPASDKRVSSTLLGAGGAATDAPTLMMNAKDAVARGLKPGCQVRVFNDLGEVILPLDITDAVPPGVVASAKGAWLATSPTGQTISALVSAVERADLGKGACYNDTGVDVRIA